MSCFLALSHINFEYDSAAQPLFQELTIQFSPGWTGIIGANGSGKTTLLKLLAGQIIPDSGHVQNSGNISFCEQEVLLPPSNCDEFFNSYDSYAFHLQQNLKLSNDMKERWNVLSMGERKKIQIAAALFNDPDILCIDEPTNHLDASGREQLARELHNFQGIGILVSHDRDLLDMLCTQCLFLEKDRPVLRSGNYSDGLKQAEIEMGQQLKIHRQFKQELKQNRRELQRRREKEQLAGNRNSKRKISRKDHDAKSKIDAARVTSRSRAASDFAGKQSEKINRLNDVFNNLHKVKTPHYKLQIPYGCYSSKNVLLDFPERTIELGSERKLIIPELCIGNKDRIAMFGDNGSGKSTLIRQIVTELKLSEDEYVYLPQELDKSLTDDIYSSLRQLSKDDFSKVMNVVASLGSVPERVLDSRSCSPGEWRKLFFGLGVLRPTSLIIMDEPTNHLDLPSIECFEQALEDCQAALLLISHDRVFINNLCPIHWRIEAKSNQKNILIKGYRQ